MASPSVRRVARELGIDLSKVRGSEPGGRIVIGDVRAYIQRLIKAAARPALARRAPRPDRLPESIDFSQWGPVTKKPLTPLRQVIVRRMSESWNAVPRVTQFDEADFTHLNALRKKFAAAYEKKGVRLTLTPLVLKALAETLKKHPIFNSSLDEAANEIVIKEYYPPRHRGGHGAGLDCAGHSRRGQKVGAGSVQGIGTARAEGARPENFRRRTEGRHVHHFQPGRHWRRAFYTRL